MHVHAHMHARTHARTHTHTHTHTHAHTHTHTHTHTHKKIYHDTSVLAMMLLSSHGVELFPGKLVSPVLDPEVPSVPLSPPPTFDLVSFVII